MNDKVFIPENFLEEVNLVPPYYADYIEFICLNKLEYSMRGTKNGTSGVSQNTLSQNNVNNTFEQFQLCKAIMNKQEEYLDLDYSDPLLFPVYLFLAKNKLDIDFSDWARVKVNLQTAAPENTKGKFSIPHRDHDTRPEQSLTAIYYVNDSDGETFFFNEKRFDKFSDIDRLTIRKKVKPEKGKMVVFRSDTLHAGSHPIESDYRIAINFNFYPKHALDLFDLSDLGANKDLNG